MNKQAFLAALEEKLHGLPQNDIEERLAFYAEMIDDKLEEGISEEDAVAALGDPAALADAIIAETPVTKLVKERVRPKRSMSGWEIALLVLGSPLWLALLLTALAVILSVFAVLWAIVIALWAVFLSFALSIAACLAAGIVALCRGIRLTGLALIGAALVFAGLTILMFFACRACTKGCAVLTKKIAVGIKRSLAGKKEV